FLLAGEGVNTQEFIFSSQGSWPAGILLALVFGWLKWHEKNKQKMNKPETRTIRVWAHERVGDMTILAAVFGFAGAKVFHNLENWDEFSADPVGALLSFSGLTFYGGLICAAIAIIIYARRKNIGIRHLADAMGPALILAYAIGRIGCQVAGDGDWGILNSAYVADKDGVVRLAEEGEFNQSLKENFAYYRTGEFRAVSTKDVPHAAFKGFAFLPDWLFAYTYPHNVNSMGVRLADCSDPEHCQYLPLPVFPTPLYETIMGLLIFGLLMFLRNRIKVAGALFSLYLVLNGVERFLIEKIRVNTKYDFGSFQPTQAELISSALVLLGLGLWFVCYRVQHRKAL
ncbi:MAG: diacylglyceryl transferase, partial [Bacteroidetes bacterium]|nr:diacylglyceryl transferase [Bacteroidota bacterium]